MSITLISISFIYFNLLYLLKFLRNIFLKNLSNLWLMIQSKRTTKNLRKTWWMICWTVCWMIWERKVFRLCISQTSCWTVSATIHQTHQIVSRLGLIKLCVSLVLMLVNIHFHKLHLGILLQRVWKDGKT